MSAMLQELFHPVITYLHHNPHSAGLIAFFIVFCEAMAVIGTIFPGSVTMSAVGVLIGSGVIPGSSTIIWAIAGAICGDTVSYLLGYYYKGKLHRVWPFRKHPQWLAKGARFFQHHGGKSVIIGRFFGPMRSMVPLVAGMLHMRPLRFLLAAIPSASVWAVAYMVPGILLGALSLELPPEIALKFIGTVLLILAIILLFVWLLQFSIQRFASKVERETRRAWVFLRTHKASHWLTRLLTNPQHPENHRQLILSFYAVVSAGLFLIITASAFSHGVFTWLNNPAYHLLRNLRVRLVDDAMLLFTILGSKEVMLASAGVIFIWFAINRKWRAANHWLGAIVLSSGAIWLFKQLLFSARPNHLLHGPINSSFPSGHTTLAVTIFGLLAVFISKDLTKENKKLPYLVAILLITLVAFSRLFLGAHWLTDIIGATLLGVTIILLTNISYHRGTIPRLGPKRTTTAALLIILITWVGFTLHDFAKYQYDYTLYWPPYTISYQQLQQHRPITLFPLYRDNRLGHPKEAFNIEWLSPLTKIKNNLSKQGWKNHEPCMSIKGLLYRLSTTGTETKLNLLPQLYQNSCPVLLMTKKIANHKQAIILQLWHANIKIKDSTTPFWLGVIKYHHAPHKLLTLKKGLDLNRLFFGATTELIPDLAAFKYREYNYPLAQQPKKMHSLHWDGKVLLIIPVSGF